VQCRGIAVGGFHANTGRQTVGKEFFRKMAAGTGEIIAGTQLCLVEKLFPELLRLLVECNPV